MSRIPWELKALLIILLLPGIIIYYLYKFVRWYAGNKLH